MLAACAKTRGEAARASSSGPAAAVDPVDAFAAALKHRERGAQRFHGASRLVVVEEGRTVEDLEELAAVDQAANGDLHASYANSRDQGRELYATGGTIWVRPRYGKFHRRPPVAPDEAARTADDIYGAFAADFDLVAAAADLREGG